MKLVYVSCLCVLDPCSQLHNSHLHWVLCICVQLYIIIQHLERTCRFGVQYLPNHFICMFFLVDFAMDVGVFQCTLIITADNAVQATSEVAKFPVLLN